MVNKAAPLVNNLIAFLLLVTLIVCDSCQRANSIPKVEMHLSAFGVESDYYPSIDVMIDFTRDSSNCRRWFYAPSHRPSSYTLSHDEMKKVLRLLQHTDFKRLKTNYTTNASDEPTSTTTIYTSSGKYVIKDYGLRGEYPLQELYRLVYKL